MPILIKPEELLLNCNFADAEHITIANTLNAIRTAAVKKEFNLVSKTLFPFFTDYLHKHLEHEERVFETALVWWIDEFGNDALLERYLKDKANFSDYRFFLNWAEDVERQYNPPQEFMDVLKVLGQQKFSHIKISTLLEEELNISNGGVLEGKKIIELLGILHSFLLNRILKSDKQYVEFYKKYNIPACGENPLLPPENITRLLKEILKEKYTEPFTALSR